MRQRLESRIGALEGLRSHKQNAAEFTNSQLIALIGFPPGYVPTDAELAQIASASGPNWHTTIDRILAAGAGKGKA